MWNKSQAGSEPVWVGDWKRVALGDLIMPLGALLGAVTACDFYVLVRRRMCLVITVMAGEGPVGGGGVSPEESS